MTNKKAIINGVDVNGCEHFPLAMYKDHPKWRGCSVLCGDCKDKPNCYYKQLQRKTAEHERLTRDYFKQNEWLQQRAKECKKLNLKIIELSVLNDTLKNECNNCEQLQRKIAECEELKDTLSKLTQSVVLPLPEPEVIDLTDCYRRALDEIEHKIIHDYCVGCDYTCDICEYKEILDIISKTKGEK